MTLANAADFPSPRKANEGGEKTVAEVERIKRNRMKEKMRGNAKTEEKAPRYYDVLPNQFEDEDGHVPEYANPALDRIRALNRNLIAQIWTGHRKLPAGILDKEFGPVKRMISEKKQQLTLKAEKGPKQKFESTRKDTSSRRLTFQKYTRRQRSRK